MPESVEKNSSQQISSEIELLEQRLAEKRMEIEKQNIQKPEKEIISEIIKERSGELYIPTSVSAPMPSGDLQNQLQILVDIAFNQSIPVAVRLSKKSGNAYLIDAIHDALVDKFYEELVRRGKIK